MSEEFWRGAVPELYQLREENAALRAEVERLQDRFDAVRDAAHAEAKRVFPATIIESHFGGEPHADDLCSMLAAEIERLRGENACLREATRWRKVEEELPSSTGWHLVRYQNDEMGQSWYRNGHGNWVDRQGKSQYPHYWQPLPEPPKEDQ